MQLNEVLSYQNTVKNYLERYFGQVIYCEAVIYFERD